MQVLDFFFFSSRRRHTRCLSDWSSDVCSSDLGAAAPRYGGACRRPHVGGDRQAVANRGTLAAGSPAFPQRRSHCLVEQRFERYITELFAAEDPILSKIRARHAAEKLPPINISPEEGKLLHVLLLTI